MYDNYNLFKYMLIHLDIVNAFLIEEDIASRVSRNHRQSTIIIIKQSKETAKN